MNIVLWADLQCPFCLVGEENLKNAIQELGLEDQINMDIKSYEIHRPEDGEGDHSLIQIFQEKDGFTYDEALDQAAWIDQMAKEEADLDIDFAKARESTDLDAHRLFKFAMDQDPKKAMYLRDLLHQAYFAKQKVLADRNPLLELAKEADLDVNLARQMLESNLYIREIRNDEMEFEALNAQSVPYFIVGHEVVPEHLTKEEMKKVLLRNLKQEKETE